VREREKESERKSVYHFARREIGPAPSGSVGGAAIEATTTDTVTELGGSIVGVNNSNGLRPRVGVVRVSAVVVLRMHRGNGELVGGIEVRMVVAMMMMMILLLLLLLLVLVLVLVLVLLEVVRVGIRRRIRVR